MKGPVLSAWLAAGLALMASGARAEPADCDLICHLQGYLTTDHMAAAAGDPSPPSAGATAKPRHHAASAPTKVAKPSVKTASKPVPTIGAAAKAPVQAVTKEPPKAVARAERPLVAKKVATTTNASPEPTPAKGLKAAEAAPKPTAADDVTPKPPKHHAVAAIASPPTVEAAPAKAPAPKRSRRIAHALPRLGGKDSSLPVASAAELIPGSAQLVPAEFQAFGNL